MTQEGVCTLAADESGVVLDRLVELGTHVEIGVVLKRLRCGETSSAGRIVAGRSRILQLFPVETSSFRKGGGACENQKSPHSETHSTSARRF